jgi:hypothetical protein
MADSPKNEGGEPTTKQHGEGPRQAAGGERLHTGDVAVQPPKSSSLAHTHHVIDEAFPDATVLLKTFPSVANLAKKALFVIDTSCLLLPFDLKQEQLDDLEVVVKRMSSENRLFVPARALREFVRNRSAKMANAYKALSDAKMPTFSLPFELSSSVLFTSAAFKGMMDSVEKLMAASEAYKKHIEDLKHEVRDWNCNDRISKLYEIALPADKIIYPDESTDVLSKEFDTNRVKKTMVVPGSKDAGSSSKGDGGIGDYVIWKSILALGKKMKQDVIFVSGETKDDWVVGIAQPNDGKEALYARFELISQFFSASGGKGFAICSFPKFLQLSGAKEGTVEDAERIQLFQKLTDTLDAVAPSKALPANHDPSLFQQLANYENLLSQEDLRRVALHVALATDTLMRFQPHLHHLKLDQLVAYSGPPRPTQMDEVFQFGINGSAVVDILRNYSEISVKKLSDLTLSLTASFAQLHSFYLEIQRDIASVGIDNMSLRTMETKFRCQLEADKLLQLGPQYLFELQRLGLK